jgi:hypothetical protein
MFKKRSKKMLTPGSESEKFIAHTEQLTTNMRTKTLLLSAAALAAGVVTSMAANTYSLNVVGYVNVTCAPGFNLVANQLDVDGTDAIGTVLNATTPSSQDSAQVLKFSNNNFSTDFYAATLGDGLGFIGWYDGVSGAPSTNTIQPGVGFYYFNPASTNITLTLTGTVLQGSSSVPLPAGFSLISTVAPQAITLDTTATNNFPAADSDEYLAWAGNNFATPAFYAATLGDGLGFIGWYDGISGAQVFPTPAVGQGYFIFNAGSPTSWTRVFNVQ